MAITCVKTKYTLEHMGKAEKSMMAKPNVIFSARTEGTGKNGVLISMHKDYTDFSNFLSDHLLEMGDDIKDHCTILISLKGRIVKPLSLAYLAMRAQ